MTDITPQLAIWIQQLCAIAQTGLAFSDASSRDPLESKFNVSFLRDAASPRVYDAERYQALLELAAKMAATVNKSATLDPALADALATRWRAEVQQGVPGYVTPKVGVGGIVFNDKDELLLIKRPEGAWLFPTGWAEVGYSPAQVVVKEVREETGLKVTPMRIIAVYDSQHWHSHLTPHLYSIVFYCRLDGGELVRHPVETLDAGFFAREALPQPLLRVNTHWIDHAWAVHRGESVETYFDR